MGANGLDEYWVPEHVKDYLRRMGFVFAIYSSTVSARICDCTYRMV